jgi:hypothetical protein
MSEPVMWTTINGKEGLVPLYTHPVDDTALLRQALEVLEYEARRGNDDAYRSLRDALRERLKENI